MRKGRRAGSPDTRATLLATAREQFLAHGYAAVSLRSIAERAGVDPSLASYFFGSKRGLFAAALELPAEPGAVVADALAAGDRAGLAERLLRGLLRVWDDPGSGDPARALVRSAAGEERAAELLREYLAEAIAIPLGGGPGGAPAPADAAVALLSGLVFTRYVLRLEPFASASADEVVRVLAPPLALALG